MSHTNQHTIGSEPKQKEGAETEVARLQFQMGKWQNIKATLFLIWHFLILQERLVTAWKALSYKRKGSWRQSSRTMLPLIVVAMSMKKRDVENSVKTSQGKGSTVYVCGLWLTRWLTGVTHYPMVICVGHMVWAPSNGHLRESHGLSIQRRERVKQAQRAKYGPKGLSRFRATDFKCNDKFWPLENVLCR